MTIKINKKEETISWLPSYEEEEDKIGYELLNYAFEETSYSIDPFATINNIHPSALEPLLQSDIEEFFPSACYIANTAIRERQNQEDFFFECWWKDFNGQYWKELHLKDLSTGKLNITRERL